MKRSLLSIVLCAAQFLGCSGVAIRTQPGAKSFILRLVRPSPQAAQAMREALSSRLDSLGVCEGKVEALGSERVRVVVRESPDIDTELLLERLLQPATLAFAKLDEQAEFFDKVQNLLPPDGAVALACESWLGEDGSQRCSRYLMATSRKRLEKFLVQLEPPAGRRLAVLNGEWGALAYLLEDPPALSVPAVNHVAVVPEPDGRPSVLIAMMPQQREAFTKLTGELVGKRLAILVDGEIRSLSQVAVPIDTGLALVGSSPLVPVAVAERQARALEASLRAWHLAGGLVLEK